MLINKSEWERYWCKFKSKTFHPLKKKKRVQKIHENSPKHSYDLIKERFCDQYFSDELMKKNVDKLLILFELK